jgi:transcription-repair coupling factor (superfamily II helicase)
MVADPANQVRVKPDQKLVFARNWPTPETRLKGAAAILSRMARLAESGE